MCGASIKQQRICGGKRNKLVFLFFFLSVLKIKIWLKKDEKGLIQTKGQDAGIMYFRVCCVLKSRVLFLSLSLSFFHSLSRFLKSSLSLYFFTSFFISFSLSLSLYNVISRSYFFYLLLLGSFSRFHFAQLLGHHEGQLDRLTRVQARVAVG